MRLRWKRAWAAIVLLGLCGSCSLETFLNQTASFGGTTAGAPLLSGARGVIRVVFENNTPFRALFTYGMYDNTDEVTTPIFLQFSPESQITAPDGEATLEGNTTSNVSFLPCGRVFSVGSPTLINLISTNGAALESVIDEAAFIEGVGFASAPLTDDFAGVPTAGFAAGFEALLGVDFNCGSLLVVRLEYADFGPDRFVVELDVFPTREQTR